MSDGDMPGIYCNGGVYETDVFDGTIQAEDYDLGGEGISYHDTTLGTNYGGSTHRTDNDVDVGSCSDGTGCLNVGWVDNGEWLEYTVNVTAGTYDINVRAALATGSFLTLASRRPSSKRITGQAGSISKRFQENRADVGNS